MSDVTTVTTQPDKTAAPRRPAAVGRMWTPGRGLARAALQIPMLIMALFRVMLPAMAVPSIVLLVPQFDLMTKLGLINSRWAVIILYVGIMLPLTLYLFRNFFAAFPNELLDAATIDGLGPLQTLLRIVLPASKPVVFTAVIINFVFAWNELLLALVFLQNEQQRTLMVGLTVFNGLYSLDVPELMAAMTLATLPVVIVYLVGQRHLMRGLLGGIGK